MSQTSQEALFVTQRALDEEKKLANRVLFGLAIDWADAHHEDRATVFPDLQRAVEDPIEAIVLRERYEADPAVTEWRLAYQGLVGQLQSI